MSQDLLKFYTEILASVGMFPDKDGNISGKIASEDAVPVTIKGKRLVLPTQERLMKIDRETEIIFHPFSENVTRGPSEVLDKLVNIFRQRVNYTTGVIIHQLMTIAASHATHAKLNPDQSLYLQEVHETDEKTISAFEKILKACTGTNQLVDLYLKRGAVLKGHKYPRAGIVRFPIIAELDKEVVFGVKLRVKDRELLKKYMLYIFPDCTNQDEYSYGSKSEVAPFADAFIHSIKGLGTCLNEVLDRFSTLIDDSQSMISPFDWVEFVDNTDGLLRAVRAVPMQGNGEVRSQPPQAPQPQPQLQMPHQPMSQPVPPVVNQRNPAGVEFNALMRTVPVLQQQQCMQPYQQPQNQSGFARCQQTNFGGSPMGMPGMTNRMGNMNNNMQNMPIDPFRNNNGGGFVGSGRI